MSYTTYSSADLFGADVIRKSANEELQLSELAFMNSGIDCTSTVHEALEKVVQYAFQQGRP